MRHTSVWHRILGLTRTVVESVDLDEEADVVVVRVRPRRRGRRRCGRCGATAPLYDRGEGRPRRWRSLDLGTVMVFLESDAPRVNCAEHGPTVMALPWARHGARHTRAFDDTVAWLATRCSKSAVSELMRISWRTVGTILERVAADIDAIVDRLEGLRRIGIDEVSYRRGHRYITAVVDHDSGRLVWAAAGRDTKTLLGFFDVLGPERCALIEDVSADGADWIERAVKARCANAVICADPFHVVAWANDALDEVRLAAWNEARGSGHRRSSRSAPRVTRPQRAHPLKRARIALRKRPERLTARQRAELEWVAKSNPKLWRAYLLKERLRLVFALGGEEGKEELDRWIAWARRSRIEPFVELSRRVVRYRGAIHATLDNGLSQARSESTNTRIRLLTRVAFGFHGPQPLIALAMLALGGHPPSLPGRA